MASGTVAGPTSTGSRSDTRLRRKFEKGFRTGDIVRAVIPNGKFAGVHVGRVAIRFGQNFQLGEVSVHPRHLHAVHRADGYAYSLGETLKV